LRVAALYDVHGNLPALEAVLGDVADADVILLGGDVVAGPFPSETLERLRALGEQARWIRGNADRELADPSGALAPPPAVLDWIRERLSEEQLAFLGRLPERDVLEVDGLGGVLFVHATPQNDVDIFTSITPEERLRGIFADVRQPVVVCGHTHMQFDRTIGGVRVVNAGSVGMAYEDEPGAYWAWLGPGVQLRRTEYDASVLLASGYPEEWPSATREEATTHFERLAVGA
jgi:putative phosphoesterase